MVNVKRPVGDFLSQILLFVAVELWFKIGRKVDFYHDCLRGVLLFQFLLLYLTFGTVKSHFLKFLFSFVLSLNSDL